MNRNEWCGTTRKKTNIIQATLLYSEAGIEISGTHTT